MAATKGFTGKGTVLSVGSGGTSETFAPVLQIKTFQFSGQTWKYDDITNASSPQTGVGVLEEALPSTMSGGTLAVSGVFLPSDVGQLALATAFNAGTLTDFKLQLPIANGQTTLGNLYAFSGYVQEFPLPDIQFDKALTIKATIKINTIIAVTLGS
jgi:hypothetical protein